MRWQFRDKPGCNIVGEDIIKKFCGVRAVFTKAFARGGYFMMMGGGVGDEKSVIKRQVFCLSLKILFTQNNDIIPSAGEGREYL